MNDLTVDAIIDDFPYPTPPKQLGKPNYESI